MNLEALKDLLYRLADDKLIIGHRNSEWTGFGPVLEEDIAFASMAQDELGHAQAFYMLLSQMGEGDPDQLAFNRKPEAFRSCWLVEMPIGDYAFSLVRHFLWDYADFVRLSALATSTSTPIAELAKRLLREEKYHLLHARTWITKLGNGTEESRLLIQSALNDAYPMALGIFEATDFDAELANSGIQPTENELCKRWIELITPVCQKANLHLPDKADPTPFLGGRRGYHSEHLAPLLNEMTEVFQIDTTAKW